ncbi:hypothetical protein [Paenibacillus sp. OSY-SE]|uniref:hypothetical protein n=1 Tax=Paenibacillus sp. OSY-SE TaxID=1196323 RepID=UPI000300FD84|nr:hypothetical protein [Paenibacillus sp. OSY-SE]
MDANYKDLIRQMIAPYFVTLSHLFEPDADYSGVDYLEQYDEEWGTSDANYTNRFRVLLAISWSEQRSEPEFELLIRHLLIQKIIDRETNSFQGAGDALHLA